MSSYHDPPQRSFLGPALIGLSLIATAASLYFISREPSPESAKASPAIQKTVLPPTEALIETSPLKESPKERLADSGMQPDHFTPQALLQDIARSFGKGDLEQVTSLIGSDQLDPASLKQLERLAALGPGQFTIREVGELSANRRTRWSLTRRGTDEIPLIVDLERGKDGKWTIEKVATPENGHHDALGIAARFFQATLSQDFEEARRLCSPKEISDAKLAGLCIIFEEANYRLREKKPLRAMFQSALRAGFLANVHDARGEKAATIGVTVKRSAENESWAVSAIDLDSLLADYATRVADGDLHYSPLVQRPEGGETLMLYFAFDEATLAPRTIQQLKIVSSLLLLDSKKTLKLTAHTDSLGSSDYNVILSQRRADAVRQYLLASGVAQEQIVAIAAGEAQPRLPNEKESGLDNPQGRRANRRAEIYLDF